MSAKSIKIKDEHQFIIDMYLINKSSVHSVITSCISFPNTVFSVIRTDYERSMMLAMVGIFVSRNYSLTIKVKEKEGSETSIQMFYSLSISDIDLSNVLNFDFSLEKEIKKIYSIYSIDEFDLYGLAGFGARQFYRIVHQGRF